MYSGASGGAEVTEAIQRVETLQSSPGLVPLRFSALKNMAQSPAHYAYSRRNDRAQTKALRLGNCLDRLVSAEDQSDVAIATTCAELLKPAGKKATGPSEAGLVLGMLEALQNHADAWGLLREGTRQRKLHWEFAGRACSGTPDTFTRSRVVDLKSTRCSSPAWFNRDGRFRGYHAQLSYYATGLCCSGLAEPEEHILVTVENTPPHPVTVFELTPAAKLAGEKLWRSWFERLMVCEASDVFPGYVESRVPFDVPDDGELTLVIDGEETEIE